jgi:flagellar basal body-associated protein FliL
MHAHRRAAGALLHHQERERGSVLLTAMVVLLMLTLVAVGVVRLSSRHTQIVNNEQVRSEAAAAANYALDMVINEPATTWNDLKTATGRVMQVNLGFQSTAEAAQNAINVTVKNMACRRARLIKNAELVKESGGATYVEPGDASCFGGSSSTGLTIIDPTAAGVATGNSNCATVLYEVEANAGDTKLLDATARVVQGVEVRTEIAGFSAGACP